MIRRARFAYLKIAWFFLTLALLILIECAYFLEPHSPWKHGAACVWLGFSDLVVISCLVSSFLPFFRRSFWDQADVVWYVAAFIIPVFITYFDLTGITFTAIEGEGFGQMGAAADSMRHNPSLGVFDSGYWSYPGRQYILNYQPSEFLGPSLVAERLGNSAIYMTGYLFFMMALPIFLKHLKAPSPYLLAAFTGTTTSLGFFVVQNARRFATDLMPLGDMLIFLGALMLFLVFEDALSLICLSWILGFFPYSYTPALAGLGLAIVILFYLIIFHRKHILVFPLLYAALAVTVSSIMQASQVNLAGKFSYVGNVLTSYDMVWRYADGFRTVCSFSLSLFPAPLSLIIGMALYMAWQARDYRYFAIIAWTAGVVICSMGLVGENINLPDYTTLRNVVTIPPVALGSILILIAYLRRNATKNKTEFSLLLRVAVVYMLITGAEIPLFSRTYMVGNMVTDSDESVYLICDHLYRFPKDPIRVLYVTPPLNRDFDWARDYLIPFTEIRETAPPPGIQSPGTYTLSYISNNPGDHDFNPMRPSQHRHPFVRLTKN